MAMYCARFRPLRVQQLHVHFRCTTSTKRMMGYTTELYGTLWLDKPLSKSQTLYVKEFSVTRRMKRDPEKLQSVPDPVREAVGMPVGAEGCYFIGEGEGRFEERHPSSIVKDRAPADQPDVWCDWVPTDDGCGIEWNGWEKFYYYVSWLQYLVTHFLQPWGYTLNGEVRFRGEDRDDVGVIFVKDNQISMVGGNKYTHSIAFR